MYSIKLSGYEVRIKFNGEPLVVEQNNYATKIVNVYIAYDLDYWLNKTLRSFTLRNCLFGATNIVKNCDTEK